VTHVPDLFEEERARDRRTLVRVLNKAAKPSRARKLPPMPSVTVPGLDPSTGRRCSD
jgi:hypothetical protein